ncbi:Phosphatidylethanolamine-binding protein-like F40A3.3, partial [Fragariocoptes setiger]
MLGFSSSKLLLTTLVTPLTLDIIAPRATNCLLQQTLKRQPQQRRTMSGLENVKKESVIPDVIDTLPSESVKVTYPSGVEVKHGNELTPTAVKDEPKLEYKASADQLYTVCMTDPDAPSRQDPKFREWLHWLVVNVPSQDVSKGQTLSQYVGSGPPQGTGLHRYVFLVYKQNGTVTSDMRLTNTSADGRGKFSIRNFAKSHNLGEPVAVNFYQAQWDDYVPKLYKQLGA